MKHLLKSFLSLSLVAMLSACETLSPDDEIDYRSSEITPTLEIPPDLISRSSNRNLGLPGSNVGTAANTGRYVETGNLNVEVRTLPLIDNITLEGQGDTHWIRVSEKAEKVYPLMRSFWAEQGFRLQLDEPALGLMETEWLTSKSGSESFFAAIFESMAGADSKDQYVTRLQRANDNRGTLIYVAHRGQERFIQDPEKKSVIVETGRSQGWQMVPANPNKESAMLSRIMIYLGMQDQAVSAELNKIGLFTARASIEYDEDDEETYLLVKHGFEQAWNRLLYQLDRLGIRLDEKDRSENDGLIRLQRSALALSDVDEEYSILNQVTLSLEGSDNSDRTRIDIINQRGSMDQSPAAKQILEYFRQQLK